MRQFFFAWVLLVGLSAGADAPTDATVLVDRPMVIDHPGKYVVTRPVRGPGTILHILSGDVEVDLGGFGLESASESAPVVRIAPVVIENVLLGNGRLRGGGTCLFADRVTGLTLRDLDLAGCAVGMVLDDNHAVTVERCRFRVSKLGLSMDTCDGCRIVDNLVIGGIDLGIGLNSGSGGEISRNHVSSSTHCLQLAGSALAVRANVVTQCVHGIQLGTTHGAIEGNLVSSTDVGFAFGSTSSGNVYRENTSRGNGTDFLDDGADNSSGGGNFVPGPR